MTSDFRERVLADPTIPETIRRALEDGLPLEEVRLDRYGAWWHADTRIEHSRIVDLFSKCIDVTDGGTHVLRIGDFVYPVIVADTPFFVVGIDETGPPGDLRVRLNDGSTERVRPETLRHSRGDRLVAPVKGGKFEARFLRGPYHRLLETLELGADGEYLLRLGDCVVQLDIEE